MCSEPQMRVLREVEEASRTFVDHVAAPYVHAFRQRLEKSASTEAAHKLAREGLSHVIERAEIDVKTRQYDRFQ